ncbi:unnamed protein product [Urochloa decumbens]|uniref:Uncharacterized protein n=1 Tax=Urochloa decumbens TaxID=240449 RepID=A0ABC9AKB5_9POAL
MTSLCCKAETSASAIVADAVTGSHVLKIEGYSLTKGLGNDEVIKSRIFDVGGHRWYIEYYPDGYGSDNSGWISFFLNLKHPVATDVKASYRFSLLNEMGEPVQLYSTCSESIRMFKTTALSSWGYEKFIKKKALEESTYLKEDSFSVRCDIVVCKEFRAEDTTQFVTVPPSDMIQHIGCLLSSGTEADVTFLVGDETFAAHRLVLGARSPVFMAELFGPMKEKHISQIKIDDMEPRVFKAMLHYIYTDSLCEVDNGDASVMVAQHLLVAADRYGIDRLKLICEDRLCNFISTGTVATTLALAEQHGCKGLKAACFMFLRSPGNLKNIMDSDGFQHLTSSCPSLLSELLANVAP